MVHGILLARVPAGDAEDLVQDVFLSAMRQLRGLRTAAAFRGWLGAIARNRAIDYHRESRERVPLEDVEVTRASSLRAGEATKDSFRLMAPFRQRPKAIRGPMV